MARLAGLKPSGVICEIMNDDGTMARMPQLTEYAFKHGLKIVSVADLVSYRMLKESLVSRSAETVLPIAGCGDFKLVVYENDVDHAQHLALVKGEIDPDQPVLVRVHSECLTGEVFGSQRCDCGEQLQMAIHQVAEEGTGVILYLRQEGRGIGLVDKIKAYAQQDQGQDTVEANESLGFNADLRDYGVGAQILAELGIKKIRLLTNNPKKMVGLQGYGLEVVERVSIQSEPTNTNLNYLKAKKEKLGHLLVNF
jgi:3,4-dihydroxy 2-butanone 4-phosphate synthase/GTP cyclohydrolase II